MGVGEDSGEGEGAVERPRMVGGARFVGASDRYLVNEETGTLYREEALDRSGETRIRLLFIPDEYRDQPGYNAGYYVEEAEVEAIR